MILLTYLIPLAIILAYFYFGGVTMNKRKIITGNANADINEINFYLDSQPDYYVHGTYINETNSINLSLEIVDEKSKENYSSTNTLLLLSLCSTIILWFFLSFYLDFLLAFIISTSISYLLMLVFYCYNEKYVCKDICSNHSAEHMICNFIDSRQRLPISIHELKESSRFDVTCGSLEDFIYFLHDLHFSFYLYASLLIYVILLFTYDYISFEKKIIITIILATIMILLLILSDLINLFIQLFNTTSNVTNDSLYLAYFVAREWMLHEYPEYASEKWMQKSEFLDMFSITSQIDSKKARRYSSYLKRQFK